MNEHVWSQRISRRSLLRGGGAAAAAVAFGLPLASCTTDPKQKATTNSTGTTPPSTARPPGSGIANVHASVDQYGFHVEPSVATNPHDARQLLVATQAAPTARDYRDRPGSAFIATYFSLDAGATWRRGALPQPPPGQSPPSDDVTVAFDPDGRGYLCASRADNTPGGRALFVFRTDDGGRSFSPPTSLVPSGQYLDHPWIAVGTGQTPSELNVYVAWAGGASGGDPSDLAFTRSTDRGESFESPRTILTHDRPSQESAGPELVAGAQGLVCAVCPQAANPDPSGDTVAEMVAVCSTDAGQTFAAPVQLGSGSLDISLPGGVKAKSELTVAIAPHDNALYAAYSTHQAGASHSDIVVSASHDHGHTWSQPLTATPHDDVTYFQPNLAVDEAGRVAISAFALADGTVNEVLLVSAKRQLHFRPPLQITTVPFDPTRGSIGSSQKEGAWWIGDYQGITASAGAFHLVWNDTRTGSLDLFAATVRT